LSPIVRDIECKFDKRKTREALADIRALVKKRKANEMNAGQKIKDAIKSKKSKTTVNLVN
jgi:hypothetical protein